MTKRSLLMTAAWCSVLLLALAVLGISGAFDTFPHAKATPSAKSEQAARRDHSAGATTEHTGEVVADVRDDSASRALVHEVHETAVTLQIVDAHTREPIAGALVKRADTADVSVASDRRGKVALTVGNETSPILRVTAAGYYSVEYRFQPKQLDTAKPTRVPMLQSVRIVGRVLDAAGSPLENASVTVAGRTMFRNGNATLQETIAEIDTPGDVRLSIGSTYGFTDATGTYCFFFPAGSGLYRFVAECKGHAPAASLPITAAPGDAVTTVDFRLGRGARITGRVLTRGKPWQGLVEWSIEDLPFGDSARTEEHGCFAFHDVAIGRVTVQVNGRGVYTIDTERTIQTEPNGEHQIEFAIEGDATISGRVVDGHGQPTAGITVIAEPSTKGRAFAAESNAHGAFEILVPRDGKFTVVLSCPETVYGTRRLPVLDHVASGAAGLVLALPKLGAIQLRLRHAATGTPAGMEGEVPHIVLASNAATEFRVLSAAAQRIEGSVVHITAPVGLADLRIRFPKLGLAMATARGLQVLDGETPVVVDVRVEPGITAEIKLDNYAECRRLLRNRLVLLVPEADVGELDDAMNGVAHRFGRILDAGIFAPRDPGILGDPVVFDERGGATVRGRRVGRHVLLAFPNDIAFTSPVVDVRADGTVHSTHCHAR